MFRSQVGQGLRGTTAITSGGLRGRGTWRFRKSEMPIENVHIPDRFSQANPVNPDSLFRTGLVTSGANPLTIVL